MDGTIGNGKVALIGPGRAGTAICLALYERGFDVTGVAGRAPEAASTQAASACLGAPARLVSDIGRGAGIVVCATPDGAIESALRAAAGSLDHGALVVHLAGGRGLEVFSELRVARPDVRVGALHPLQTLMSASGGLERLAGSWAAVAGDPDVRRLAESLDLIPFELADGQRARYHAAAVVASNHVVALLGQVRRLAAACGVPFEAFRPLVAAAVDNVFEFGPEAALTGPVARGDSETVERHLRELDPADRDLYRALAREALRLAPRRDTAIERLLDDLRNIE